MKKFVLTLAALFVIAGTTSASAHDSFGFSINLGAPSFYVGPPVVYGPPPVYYSPPPVVYYDPPPVVYYEPAPVYFGAGRDVRYYNGPRFFHEHGYYRGRHGHGRGHHDDDDDD